MIRYYLGKGTFWFFAPLIAIFSIVWWREDSLFMIRHIYMALTGKDELR